MSSSIPIFLAPLPTHDFALPPPEGLEAAFNRYESAARAVPADKLAPRRGDMLLARHNLLTGLSHLAGKRGLLEKLWLPARVEALFALDGIADAAVFAERRAEGIAADTKTLNADIARSYILRDLLLSPLETAVKFELVPGERVSAIRAGRGALDTALDIVDAVAIYREFDRQLAHKTPVTFELLDDAQKLGNSLLQRVTPNKALNKPATDADARADADLLARQFWTLVADLHAEARMAGREIWGNAYGQYVPALQAAIRQAAPKVEAQS